MVVDRFGLNYDTINSLGLTWIDGIQTGNTAKEKCSDLADPNHKQHGDANVQEYLRDYCPAWSSDSAPKGGRKCEANAIIVAQKAGRQLLRDAIEKYLPGANALYQEHQVSLRDAREELWVKRFGTDEGFDDDE